MSEPLVPHMPPEARAALERHLRAAGTYLEFGAGGSTVLAAQLSVPSITSIESSKAWIDHVAGSIGSFASKSVVRLLHADIGETKEWGHPVDDSAIRRWPGYFWGAWEAVRQGGLDPDLVLVDGRFRVACFLSSLLHLPPGRTILWDDYVDRPQYRCVEAWVAPTAYHSVMAEFHVPQSIDRLGVFNQLFAHQYVLD